MIFTFGDDIFFASFVPKINLPEVYLQRLEASSFSYLFLSLSLSDDYKKTKNTLSGRANCKKTTKF